MAVIATAGLIIWSASQVANLVWHIVVPDSQAVASGIPLHSVDASLNTHTQNPVDLQRLRDVFVLRAPGQSITGAQLVDSASAVETRLALTLKGAVLSSRQDQSRAIIASGDVQQIYRAGDLLLNTPGSVRLTDIHQLYVVLDNNGRAELLRMDDTAAAAVTAVSVQTPAVLQPGNLQTESAASSDTLFAGRALTDLLRIQPVFAVQGGSSTLQGLQIRHGSRHDFLRAVGLQQGDVITAVDGNLLRDAAQLPDLMARLSQAQKLLLTVMRNDMEVQVSLDRSAL